MSESHFDAFATVLKILRHKCPTRDVAQLYDPGLVVESRAHLQMAIPSLMIREGTKCCAVPSSSYDSGGINITVPQAWGSVRMVLSDSNRRGRFGTNLARLLLRTVAGKQEFVLEMTDVAVSIDFW